MNKKIGIAFTLGIIIGAFFCGMYFTNKDSTPKTIYAARTTNENSPDEIPLEENIILSSETYIPWDSDTVYNGGDEVVYKNKIYRAKWWTQGEKPDNSDVWEDTMQTVNTPSNDTDSNDKNSNDKNSNVANSDNTNTDKKENSNTSKNTKFKAVGYFPSWKPAESKNLRYDVLTHIIYAFAIPKEDGTLRPLDNPDTAKKIIKEAHKNGVKVLLAIGGWSYNDIPLEPTFVSATKNDKKYKAFANQIIKMCDTYGFDGIDMDWEHPRVDDKSAKQYEKLMLYLGKKLHKKGKLLTSAVISGVSADGNIYYDAAAHSDKVLKAVDWINVMAYDGGDGERHSTYKFAVNCAKYWKNTRKMPSKKVVLGLPFYARPSWASYGDILAADKNAWKSDHTKFNGMDVYYNGISTIKKKTTYAKKNLGGVMIWEVTQDSSNKSKSLLTAIKSILK